MTKPTLKEKLEALKEERKLRQFAYLLPKGEPREKWKSATNTILRITQECANAGIEHDNLQNMINSLGVISAQEVGNTNVKLPKGALSKEEVEMECKKAGIPLASITELSIALRTKNEMLKKHKRIFQEMTRR